MNDSDWILQQEQQAESDELKRHEQADAAAEVERDEQHTLLTEFVNYLLDLDYKVCTESCHRINGRSEWAWENTPIDADEVRALINSFLRDRALLDAQPPATGPEGG